jgi:hypothetical protein
MTTFLLFVLAEKLKEPFFASAHGQTLHETASKFYLLTFCWLQFRAAFGSQVAKERKCLLCHLTILEQMYVIQISRSLAMVA